MKRSLLLTLLSCAYIISPAINENLYANIHTVSSPDFGSRNNTLIPLRLDSTESYTNGPSKTINAYSYDGDQRITECRKYGSDRKIFEKIVYTYTPAGMIESETLYENNQFTNNELKVTQVNLYEYYPDNTLYKQHIENPSIPEKSYYEYSYPDGGTKIDYYRLVNNIWNIESRRHTDKRGFVLLDERKTSLTEGVVDASTNTYTSNTYKRSETNLLIAKSIQSFTSDWKYILYDEQWGEDKQCSYCTAIPLTRKEYIRNDYGYIIGKTEYVYNTRTRKWVGLHKTYAEYYETEPGMPHTGHTKKDIMYTLENDGTWRQGWESDYDKTGNLLNGQLPASYRKSESRYDFRVLPDGFRYYTKSLSGLNYENEFPVIYELDNEGFPVSVNYNGQHAAITRNESIENNLRKIVFTYPFTEGENQKTMTLTFLFNEDHKINTYSESKSATSNLVYKTYAYNNDTIICNNKQNNTSIWFTTDMHIAKKEKHDTDPKYYTAIEWDSKGRVTDSVSVVTPNNSESESSKIKYAYNAFNGMIDAKHEAIGNKYRDPADPAYWDRKFGYSIGRDENNQIKYKKSYSDNALGNSLTEEFFTYHSQHPDIMVSSSKTNYRNESIIYEKNTLYHYSEWDTTSDEKTNANNQLSVIYNGQEIIIQNHTQESGTWSLYNINGVLVRQGVINSDSITVRPDKMSKGVYILKADITSCSKVIRFIIQ